jgi:hypothetical protein
MKPISTSSSYLIFREKARTENKNATPFIPLVRGNIHASPNKGG